MLGSFTLCLTVSSRSDKFGIRLEYPILTTRWSATAAPTELGIHQDFTKHYPSFNSRYFRGTRAPAELSGVATTWGSLGIAFDTEPRLLQAFSSSWDVRSSWSTRPLTILSIESATLGPFGWCMIHHQENPKNSSTFLDGIPSEVRLPCRIRPKVASNCT